MAVCALRKGGATDIDKAEQEVMAAIRAGVNYLDTAYVYPEMRLRSARS